MSLLMRNGINMRYSFRMNLFDRLSCWFYNSIVGPVARRHDRKKKTHYECCVCGMLEAPYFYEGTKYTSIRYDYGWHKLDGGKRWICHHCADHGFSPVSAHARSFEDWYETFVVPQRVRVRGLIKTKDPEYYNECYFYDDEESVQRYVNQLYVDTDD